MQYFKDLFIKFQNCHFLTNENHKRRHDLIEVVTHRHHVSNAKHWSNSIKTSKYTLWNFIPLNLYYQFHYFANIYFLVAAILQTVDSISDSGGRPVLLLPLCVVLTVSAIKDGIEDIQRHRADREENEQSAHVVNENILFCPGRCIHNQIIIPLYYKDTKWANIRLGDLLILSPGDLIPCDIVIIGVYSLYRGEQLKNHVPPSPLSHTSHQYSELHCQNTNIQASVQLTQHEDQQIFVETKSLDGETNFKPKVSPIEASTSEIADFHSLKMKIDYEKPNPSLYTFSGKIILSDKIYPLSMKNLLLRGSSIAPHGDMVIIGVAIYLGEHSRVYQNSHKATVSARNKMSRLMTTYNNHVIILFLAQFAFCLISAVISMVENVEGNHWYLRDSNSSRSRISIGLQVLGTLLLQFTYFVPISLLVTLEIVKFFQSRFISGDAHMRYDDDEKLDQQENYLVSDNNISKKGNFWTCQKTKTKSTQHIPLKAAVNSSTLVEELGTISHIFSDKTGTLTDNVLRFAAIGLSNGLICSVINDDPKHDQGDKFSHIHPNWTNKLFNDFYMDKEWNTSNILTIWCMALCHTVLVREEGIFDATSPDEGAICEGLAEIGISLYKRLNNEVYVKLDHSKIHENLLNLLLHVVDDDRIVDRDNLICHDKHTSVNRRYRNIEYDKSPKTECDKNYVSNDTVNDNLNTNDKPNEFNYTICNFTICDVIEFDNDRKRQSVFIKGFSSISPVIMFIKGADCSMISNSTNIENSIHLVKNHLQYLSTKGLRTLCFGYRYIESDEYLNFSSKFRLQRALDYHGENNVELAHIIDNIESSLTISGVSGIEDKLQDGVEETICQIHNAKIKIWVLTGDKLETAVNIAQSTKLIRQSDEYILRRNFILNDPESVVLDLLKILKICEETICPEAEKKRDESKDDCGSSPRSIMSSTSAIYDLAKHRTISKFSINKSDFISCEDFEDDEEEDDGLGHLDHNVFRMSKLSNISCDLENQLGNHLHSSKTTFSLPIGKNHISEEEECPRSMTDSHVPMRNSEGKKIQFQNSITMTISGDVLSVILSKKRLRQLFFKLALNYCSTVIACRVSPKQKSQCVEYSRRYIPSSSTLAIGDGANDVGMIIAAHVGVGVVGREGTAAVRSADFAIPRFKFLQNLLFVHGRECLRKNALFIYLTVYKNIAFSMPAFFFGFYCGFSGTALYDPYLKQIYNTIFTLLPVMIFAICDREFSYDIFKKSPFLYTFGSFTFGMRTLLIWMLYGIYTGGISTCISISIVKNSLDSDGLTMASFYNVGLVIFGVTVFASNLILYRFQNLLNTFIHFTFWIGGIIYILAWLSSSFVIPTIKESFPRVLLTWPTIIVFFLLCVSIIFLPLWILHTYRILTSPNNSRILKERVKLKVFNLCPQSNLVSTTTVNDVVTYWSEKEKKTALLKRIKALHVARLWLIRSEVDPVVNGGVDRELSVHRVRSNLSFIDETSCKDICRDNTPLLEFPEDNENNLGAVYTGFAFSENDHVDRLHMYSKNE